MSPGVALRPTPPPLLRCAERPTSLLGSHRGVRQWHAAAVLGQGRRVAGGAK